MRISDWSSDVCSSDLIAVGFNQASVATAVQALGVDNPLYEAVLVQNAATAQASFGDLSGEILASAMSGLTDDSRHLRNSLMGMNARRKRGVRLGLGLWRLGRFRRRSRQLLDGYR